MFDGAAVATAVQVTAENITHPDAAVSATADPLAAALAEFAAATAADPVRHNVETAGATALAPATDGVSVPTEIRAADPSLNDGRREVVFIDAQVADYQNLMDGVRAGVGIELIDSSQSGLAQIAAWAQTHGGYDAIHIVSHGNDATLKLGADRVSSDQLSDTAVQTRLAAIGSALHAGGDLLLYGCGIGVGDEGQAFLKGIAAATGADVAASTDGTGQSPEGGNWVLEASTGPIDSRLPFDGGTLDAYAHVLATPVSTNLNSLYILQTTEAAVSSKTLTNIAGSGWDASWTQTANGIMYMSGESGGHYGLTVSRSGTTGELTTFNLKTNDGSEINFKSIYLVPSKKTGTSITLTLTGYRNGSAVTGATFSQLAAGGWQNYDTSENLAFQNIDEVRITATVAGKTGDGWTTLSIDDIVIGPAVDPGGNVAPVLDASKSPTFTTQYQLDTGAPVGAVGTLVSQLIGATGVANYSDTNTNTPGMAITATNTTNGSWYYTTDGGGAWTAVGTVSNTSALLLKADDNTRLYFKTNGAYLGTISNAITFRAWDRTSGTVGSKATTATNGGSTAFSSATDTASLTISFLNTAPTLDLTKWPSLSEQNKTDQSVPVGAVGTLVSDLIGTTGVANYADVDGDSPGMAITYVNTLTARGSSWYYTTNGGATWTAVGAVSDSKALLLKADDNTRLYFVNNGTYSGRMTAAVTFRAWDGSSGAAGTKADASVNGGSTPFSTNAYTADLNIKASNAAPIFTTTTATLEVNAGSTNNSYASLVTISDIDSGQTKTWSVVTGPGHGTLALSNTTATTTSGGTSVVAGSGLTYTPTAGYAGADSFTIQVSDGAATINKTITVTVKPAAPSTPVLQAASDSGNPDNITNAGLLKFSGTGAAYGTGSTDGSDVIVFISTRNDLTGDGATALGSNKYTTISASGANTGNGGAWSDSGAGIDVSGLSSGAYYVYAYTRSLIGSVGGALCATPLAVVIDRIAPTLSSTGNTPGNGDTAVAKTTASIVLEFSEAVFAGATGNITLHNLGDGNATTNDITYAVTDTSHVTVSGSTVTVSIGAAALLGASSYSVRIAPTALVDAAGNAFAGFANDSGFSFTTANTAPAFDGGATGSFTVNRNDGPLDITSLMGVTDTDPNQTLTWSVSSATDHGGTVSITNGSAATGSGGSSKSPASVVYTPNNGYSGTETFTIQVSDGTSTATRSFTVTVNAPPSATTTTTALAYTEQAAATAVDGAIAVTDAENGGNGNWDGGSVSVRITSGADSSDTLALPANSGTGIGFASGSVYFNGAVIGTATAGSATGSTALTVTLNGSADNAAVQALARAVTFANAGATPASGNRTVTFSFKDGQTGSPTTTATRIVAFALKNDAPTLTVTAAASPTFTEGGASGVALFTAATAGTVETGQKIAALTIQVSGVQEAASELLTIDGSAVALSDGATIATTAANGYAVSVSTTGATATITVTKTGHLTTTQVQDLITGLTYRNSAGVVTAGNRTVTLASIQDSGGAANGGADTATLSGQSVTVGVVAPNHAPTLTATGDAAASFTEKGSAAALFSGTMIDTGDSGQAIKMLTLTVANLADGDSEVLVIDGSSVALVDGANLATAANGYAVAVAVTAGAATVTIAKTAGFDPADAEALVDGLAYKNLSGNPTVTGGRTVTLTAVQDDGGTAGGGVDTATVSVTATVSITAVNDAPTLTAPPSFSVNDGIANAVTGVSLDDVDIGGGALTVTITTSGNTIGAAGLLDLTTTAGLTGVSGAGTATLSFTGTLADVNAALAGLTYQSGMGAVGTETIGFSIVDGALPAVTGAITVSYTNNDTPVLTAPGAQTIGDTEEHPLLAGVADFINGGGAMTATVRDTYGALSFTNTTGITFGGADTAHFKTLTGSLSDINNALQTLVYTADGTTTGADTVTVTFTDDFAGSPLTASKSITVTLTGNAAPVIAVPGAQTVTLGAGADISGVAVTDGSVGDTVTATVSVADTANGSLSFSADGGATITGATTKTITGTLAQVNAALGNLHYSSARTTSGVDTITVTFDDGGTALIGGAKTATVKTIAVTVTANAAPAITGAATLSAADSVAAAVPIQVAADADDAGGALTLTVSASHGTLAVTGTAVTGDGTGSLSFTGTLAQVNAVLANLAYTGAQYYNGSDTIVVTVNDGGASLIGGAKSTTVNITTTVTHEDVAPEVTVTGGLGNVYDIDAHPLATSITVADPDVGATVMTATVTTSNGGVLHVDGSVGATVASGNDSSSLIFTGTLTQINAALATLTYKATANGIDTVTVTVQDGNSGYTNDGKSHSQTITVAAGSVAPPTLTLPAGATINDTVSHAVSGLAIDTTGVVYTSVVQVTVSDASGILHITTTGVTITGGANDSTSITFTGTLAQVNAALGTLTYRSTASAGGTEDISVTASFLNTVDGAQAMAAPATITQTLVANAAATASGSVTAATSFTDTGPHLISGVQISDDGAGATVTATASAQHGSLTVTPGGASVTNNATGAVTISGSLSAVNAALATLTYASTATASGADTITVSVNDGGASLIGGAKTGATHSIAITLTENDVPQLSLPAATPSFSDTSDNLVSGGYPASDAGNHVISIADGSAGAYTVTVSDLHGTLTFTQQTGVSSLTGNGTNEVVITGDRAGVNATLATLTYRTDVAATGVETISVLVNDGDTGAIGGAKTAQGSFQVALVGNDTPVVTAPTDSLVVGDAHAHTVTGFAFDDTRSGGSITATVSTTGGLLHLTAADGATLSANDSTQVTVTGSKAAVNATLASFLYQASRGVAADTIQLSVDDGNGSAIGGAKTGLGQLAVTVAPNDAPVMSEPSGRTFYYTADNAAPDFGFTDSYYGEDYTATISVGSGWVRVTAAGAAAVADNGAALVSVTGSLADVNATLATLRYTTTRTSSGTDTLTVTVDDNNLGGFGGRQVSSQSAVFTLVENDTPSLVSAGGQTFERTINGIGGFVVGDGLNEGGVTVVVSDVSGLLSFSPQGGASISGNGSASVTISGPVTAVNATLATLSYTATLAASGTDSITVTVDDGASGRIGGAKGAGATIPITLIANDTPLLRTPTPAAFSHGAGNALPGFVVADGLNDGSLTATVSGVHSLLTVTAVGGAAVGGNGGGTVTITGTLADVNATLATLTYATTLTADGSDTVTVRVDDGAAGRIGGARTASGSVTIALTGNDTPVLSKPADQSFSNVAGNAIAGFAIADERNTGAVIATISGVHGVLSVSASGGAAIGGNGSGTVTITGTLADVNATLTTLTYATTLTDSGADTITLSVSDGASALVGGAKAATGSITITLTGSEAPSLAVGSPLVVRTGVAAAVSGLAVAGNPGALATVTLSAGHGILSAGPHAGAAITLTGSFAEINEILAGLRYTTALGAGGTDAIAVSVSVGAAGSIGGIKTASGSMAVTAAGATTAATVAPPPTANTTVSSPSVLLSTPPTTGSGSVGAGGIGAATTAFGRPAGDGLSTSGVSVGGVDTGAHSSDGVRSISFGSPSGTSIGANGSGNQVLTVNDMGGAAIASNDAGTAATPAGYQVLTLGNMGGASATGLGLDGGVLSLTGIDAARRFMGAGNERPAGQNQRPPAPERNRTPQDPEPDRNGQSPDAAGSDGAPDGGSPANQDERVLLPDDNSPGLMRQLVFATGAFERGRLAIEREFLNFSTIRRSAV